GEWLKYSVDVAAAGLYTISARVASSAAGGSFHIEFNGVDKTGAIPVPNTGGGQTWETLSVNNVLLDAREHGMTLVLDANGTGGSVANFNYLQATVTQSNLPPTVALTAPRDLGVFSAPANFILSADAKDPDGSIAKVDFLASGFLIGTDTTFPY